MYDLVVVDDEQGICELITSYIESENIGFRVVGQFSNGKDCLAFMQNQTVDCVVTDIKMPHMTGMELAREIYERNIPCKVILFSGYSEFEDARRAIQYGVYDYLLKPLDPEQLTEKLFMLKLALDEEKEKLAHQKELMLLGIECVLLEVCLTNKFEQKLLAKLEEFVIGREIINKSGTLLVMKLHNLKKDEETQENILRNMFSVAHLDAFLLDSDNGRFMFCVYGDWQESLWEILGAHAEIEVVEEYKGIEELRKKYFACKKEASKVVAVSEARGDVVIEMAVSYINKNYDKPISREGVAEMCFMTPSYFGSYFKRKTGMTFIDYLTKVRIENAMKLLHSNLSLNEVSEKVGYGSVRHFVRVFKAQTGHTPSGYRYEILKQELKE